jgi:hypothetical protein
LRNRASTGGPSIVAPRHGELWVFDPGLERLIVPHIFSEIKKMGGVQDSGPKASHAMARK